MRCDACPCPAGAACLLEGSLRACAKVAEGDPRFVALAKGEAVPFVARVANASRAAGRFVAAGLPLADEALRASRLATCGDCPFLDAGRCRLCGCWTAAKARLATESCPDGRWPAPLSVPSGRGAGPGPTP